MREMFHSRREAFRRCSGAPIARGIAQRESFDARGGDRAGKCSFEANGARFGPGSIFRSVAVGPRGLVVERVGVRILGKISDSDDVARENRRALDHVLQLANVARPAPRLERLVDRAVDRLLA